MAHPYVVQPAKSSGGGIQNGSLVVMVTETGSGSLQVRTPEVNSFVDSGVMDIRLSGRFDEHYGGGAS
jgi:hypothetical protein